MRDSAQRNAKPDPLQRASNGTPANVERLDAVDPLRSAEDLGPFADELLDDDAESKRHHGEVWAPHPQRGHRRSARRRARR